MCKFGNVRSIFKTTFTLSVPSEIIAITRITAQTHCLFILIHSATNRRCFEEVTYGNVTIPKGHDSSSEHGWSSLQSRPLGRSLPRPICSRKVLLPSFGHHFHVTIVLLWQHKIWIENCLFLGTNWWIKFHPTNLKLLCGMSSCDNDIRFTPECWRPFSQTPGSALNKTLTTLYVYLSSVTKKIIK